VVLTSVVTDHLVGRGIAFEVTRHTQTLTTVDEARAIGIPASEVVKTLVVNTASGHALAVVPSSRRLDMELAQRATGDRHARLASEEELTRDFALYELGAVPPLGSLLAAPVYVDPEVWDHETVVFAAGTHTESIRVRTDDLFEDTSVIVVPLSRRDRTHEPDA
jgi:Ala-tRNA(Pro) deacylase